MRKVFNFGFWMAVIILTFCFAAMPVEAATTEYGEGSEAYEALMEEENCTIYGWAKLDDNHTRYDFEVFDDGDYAIGWVIVENELDESGDLVIVAGQAQYYDHSGRHDLVWHPDRDWWVVYVGGLPATDW